MMRKRYAGLLLLLLVVLLVLVTGCKRECKEDTDCDKPNFIGACVDKKCDYTPIPNRCGNELCEANENACTCPDDCGFCAGSEGPFLTKSCIDDKCILDVDPAKLEIKSFTQTLTSLGNQFKLAGVYPLPFNFKKDTFDLTITLEALGRDSTDVEIKKITLLGTQERQQVELVSRQTNKPLKNLNAQIIENIPLDIITIAESGDLINLVLKIDYEYAIRGIKKTSILQYQIRGVTFTWVKPDVEYGCPESCDDNNPGTEDVCNAGTRFFCEHRPIPGKCGNFVCDGTENKCTCPQDCGLCSGDAGQFVSYQCSENQCITIKKAGISVEPVSIFDDRNLNVFRLQNNYNYNKPFDISTDTLELEMTLFSKRDTVSSVKITTVRVLEGTKELAVVTANQLLPSPGSSTTVNVQISDFGLPESEKTVTLVIFYDYVENDELKQGSFNKALGKITFINPG